MDNMDILEYEVKNAIDYSLEGQVINNDKLLHFQKELAMDSRYSFKIVNLLKYCNVLYIEYKSKKFIYLENKVIRI